MIPVTIWPPRLIPWSTESVPVLRAVDVHGPERKIDSVNLFHISEVIDSRIWRAFSRALAMQHVIEDG